MATGTIKSDSATPRPSGEATSDFIQRRLDRTRFRIRIVDLITSSACLLIGVLAFLLTFAVIDHWVADLGFAGRLLALLVLVAAVVRFAAIRLWPIAAHRINPMFAARAIEHNEPSLKNSLVNFLSLREDREGIRDVVFDAVQQRAASDLRRTQLDLAVDQARMIRVGYVLAAVLVVGLLYQVLSPKSTLSSFRRVLVPWADVNRPARISILEVTPGDVRVYFGQDMDLEVRAQGVRTGEPVRVFYSSSDQRIHDAVVDLQSDPGGLKFRGRIPPDGRGVRQNLQYRIEAGDAAAGPFQVEVLPAPTITVELLEYAFPRYTKLPQQTVARQGDIRALEGTEVAIRAEANQPIQSAYVEFDPESTTPRQQRSRKMEFRERQASYRFKLRFREDGVTPEHQSYQLWFVNQDGLTSQQPVLHQIEIVPDLSPEIQILRPNRTEIQVPADRSETIEIRALDPDFGLRRIALRAVSGGVDLLDASLMEDDEGKTGQTLVKYSFSPRRLKLAPGDRITYWAVAEDNRVDVDSEQPNGNRQRTANQTILITEPRAGGARPAQENGSPPENQSEDSARPNATDADESQSPKSSDDADADQDPQKDQGGKQDDSKQDDSQQDDSQQDDSQQDDSQQDGSQQDGSQQDGSQQDGSQQDGSQQDGSQQDGSQQDGSSSEPSDDASAQSPTDGGSGQTRKGSEQNPSGTGDSASIESADGSTANSDGANSSGQPSPTQRTEKLHPGEVIEKTLQHIRESQNKGQSPSSTDSDGTGQNSQNEQTGQNDPSGGQNSPQEGGPSKPQNEAGSSTNSGGQDQEKTAGQTPQGSSTQESKTPQDQGENPSETSGLGDDGQSGAGQKSDDQQGSIQSQNSNVDKAKGDDGAEKPGKGDQPQSPSNSNQQSDSKGKEGDRSGGGGKGGGQGANQGGLDSPGSNTPADQGSNAAPQPGQGQTGTDSGNQQPSKQATGNPGKEPGDGSGTRPGSEKAGEGAKPGETEKGDPGQSPPGESGPPNGRSASGLPTGGGIGSDVDGGSNRSPDGDVPDGDAANLDYARRAAEMALEHLKDQEHNPDPKLLEELQWTPEDLRQFVRRWEQLKKSAREDDARQRELDDTLRGLGLRPKGPRARRVGDDADAVRGLHDSSNQSRPPASFQEQFNAFKKGASRAG